VGHAEVSGEIHYAHADNHKERMRAGAKVAARAYLAAGAVEVEIPLHRPVLVRSERDLTKLDDVPFEPCTAPLLSAHQQGGLRMASSRDRGSCDPSGLLWGTRGVYCFDSGVFPSSASSHTQAPIITVARFLTARLLAS
jgi:choline dehydrogenase-like flavoprotein